MRVYSNNYLTSLSAAIITTDTTMTVSSAVGLPSISGSQYFYLTIDGGFAKEIVKVTAVASNTLTIVRAQESTPAVNWAKGVVVELRYTAASVIDWTDATASIVTTGNVTANQHISGYTTTVTAAGTTTLTATSARNQFFTGSTTQTCKLPVTSTLVLGQQYFIMNNSSGVVTVQSSGANTVQAIGAGSSALVTCISLSGTTAASWSVLYTQVGGSGVTGPGSSTANGIATYSGTGGSTLLDNSATIASGVLTTVKDAVLNTVSVGLGLNGTSTNTAVGFTALGSDTSSSANNTCVGYKAGNDTNKIGNASQCTVVGASAGGGTTSGATNNTCVGYKAGSGLAVAASCTLVGASAGGTGSHSSMTLVGAACGTGAGANDTMMGANAGFTGSGDYFGSQAGRYPTGSLNCAFGNSALIGASAGSSAGSNSAFGYAALGSTSLTSAIQNCAFGYNAGISITTGNNNSFFGYLAGGVGASGAVGITTGTDNTCVGFEAGADTLSAIGCLALGSGAVAAKSTGSTSGTNGPGIAVGSAGKLVGFRGDGSIYPTTDGSSSGFWRIKVNGTHYFVPLFADGTTTRLSSPNIITPNILDSNGVTALQVGTTASAVNYIQIFNRQTTAPPYFSANGTDANIGYLFNAKGTGVIQFATSATSPLQFISGTGQQHQTTFAFPNTSAARTVTLQDIDFTVAPVVVTKANGTEASNAVTASGNAGVITTSSLTTAAGSSYVITWTNTAITASSVVMLTISGGTNTAQDITLKCVSGSGSATLTVYNNTAVTALNGTVLINYFVC